MGKILSCTLQNYNWKHGKSLFGFSVSLFNLENQECVHDKPVTINSFCIFRKRPFLLAQRFYSN